MHGFLYQMETYSAAVFLWFYFGGISRYLSIYTISTDGIKVKLPFRKTRFFPWDAFQEICIQDDLFSRRKGYTKCICIVLKGEKKGSLTGKWKGTGFFNYAKVLTMIYTKHTYEEIAQRCPSELLNPPQTNYKKATITNNSDNDCLEKIKIFRTVSISDAIFGGLVGIILICGCIYMLYLEIYDQMHITIFLLIFSFILIYELPFGWFRKYIFTEKGIIKQALFSKKYICHYYEITVIKKSYAGNYICYSNKKLLFIFSAENKEMVEYLMKKIPSDARVI